MEGRSGRAVCEAVLVSMGGGDAVILIGDGIVRRGTASCPAGTTLRSPSRHASCQNNRFRHEDRLETVPSLKDMFLELGERFLFKLKRVKLWVIHGNQI